MGRLSVLDYCAQLQGEDLSRSAKEPRDRAQSANYALVTLPERRQLVQTRIFLLLPPCTLAFTGCRFTFQRRLVMLCACEMLLPNCGPLPQTSQTRDIDSSRTLME